VIHRNPVTFPSQHFSFFPVFAFNGVYFSKGLQIVVIRIHLLLLADAKLLLFADKNTPFDLRFDPYGLAFLMLGMVILSTMRKKPNIILVDDHLVYRRSIKSVLTNEGIACIIGEANNGIEFLESLLHLRPDMVLMDINMPLMTGIEATQKAMELMPDLKIIAYTMFGEEEYYQKMIGNGAKGFILKSGGIDELEKAIGEVMMGNNYFPSHVHK